MKQPLFVKVGGEDIRGPLAASDVRAALASGVLPQTARAGTSNNEDELRPISDVLDELAKIASSEEEAGARTRSAKKTKAITIALVLFVVSAIAGGVTLWITTRPPPLCPATPHILAKLKNGLQIDVYATRKIKKVDQETKKIEALLAQMRAVGNGKVEYKVIDTSTDEDAKKRATEAGLQMTSMALDDSAATVPMSGYFGIVFSYGAEREKIPIVMSADGIEFWIDNKIREISAKADGWKKRIGVVTGHHEVSISDAHLIPVNTIGSGSGASGPNMRAIITQYFPFYQVVDIDATKPVPDDIDGLLVTAPMDDFKDEELHAIDDFVMTGKALAIVSSAAVPAVSDAIMKVKLSTHGLEKLTDGYGLELGRNLVLEDAQNEKASTFRVSVSTMSGPKDMRFAFIPKATESVKGKPNDTSSLDSSSAIFFRLGELYFPFASSITTHQDRQPTAQFRVLARTSSFAVRESRESEIEVRPMAPVGKLQGSTISLPSSVIVAASVEGKLTSAFGSGAKSKQEARVLVIASSLFLTNPFARAGAPPPSSSVPGGMGGMMAFGGGDEVLNQIAAPYAQTFATTGILVFKNLLDWLTFEENMTTCLPLNKPDDESDKKKK